MILALKRSWAKWLRNGKGLLRRRRVKKMNAIFALVALGHSPDDPLTAREIDEFSRFEIEEGDTIRVAPCVSPVWDTAIAMVALEEAGLPPDHPALIEAASWLLKKQISGSGDWMLKTPGVLPGGWAFEFRNDFYPDVDDTAFVLMALQRVDYPDKARMEAATRRALTWLLLGDPFTFPVNCDSSATAAATTTRS